MENTKLKKRFFLALGVAIVTAICIYTPVLWELLDLVGLSGLFFYLDYVLYPALGILIILTVISFLKWKKVSGIKVFAWLFLVWGTVGFIISLFYKGRLLAYQAKYITFPESYYYVNQAWGSISSVLMIIIGIGLLKLLNWGRLLAITLHVLALLFLAFSYFIYTKPYLIPYFINTGKPVSGLYFIMSIGTLLSLFTIYFFTRKKVKEQFI